MIHFISTSALKEAFGVFRKKRLLLKHNVSSFFDMFYAVGMLLAKR